MNVAGVVVECHHDGASRAFQDGARIGAARIAQILHLAGVATGEPVVEMSQLGKHFAGVSSALATNGDDAAEVEAQRLRARSVDPASLLGGVLVQ